MKQMFDIIPYEIIKNYYFHTLTFPSSEVKSPESSCSEPPCPAESSFLLLSFINELMTVM